VEVIKDYWYVVVPALITVLFLFGYRTKKGKDTDINEDLQNESVACGKADNGCHGCCK